MATKVCPRCSVLSETDSDSCPSCGARYSGRRGLSRLEVGAIAVTAAALAVGATALVLGGDDEQPAASAPAPAPSAAATPPPHTIRFEQAAALRAGTPRSEVVAEFGPPRPTLDGRQKRRLGEHECIYYDVTRARTDAMLCFRDQKLTVVAVNYPDAPPRSQRRRAG